MIESLVVVVVVAVFVLDNGCAAFPEQLFPAELPETKQPFVRRAENRSPLAPSTGIIERKYVMNRGGRSKTI